MPKVHSKNNILIDKENPDYELYKKISEKRINKINSKTDGEILEREKEKHLKGEFEYDYIASGAQILKTDTEKFKALKNKTKNKLRKYLNGGNIAIVDECGGFYKENSFAERMGIPNTQKDKDVIFEPERGVDYYSTGVLNTTLAASKRVIEEALADLDAKNKVLVLGMRGDDRVEGGPWRRVRDEKGERVYNLLRRVNTAEERREAMLKIKAFEEVGRKVGQEIRKQNEEGK